MQYQNYTGLALKHQTVREADEIITLWSWEAGKVRLLVRGARKSTSRLKAALAPLAWLSVQAVSSERFPVVVGARVLQNYGRAGQDLARLAAVFSVFELVLKATPDSQPNPALTGLLRRSLEYLDGVETFDCYGFLAGFHLRVMGTLGYELNLGACIVCGAALAADRVWWSPILFGPVCDRCAKPALGTEPIAASAVAAVAAFQASPEAFVPPVDAAARSWLVSVLRYLLERDVKSEKFLRQTVQQS